MCDKLYHNLPIELRRVVASYIPIWSRHGLTRPPMIFMTTHESFDKYFYRIRKCPRGAHVSFFRQYMSYRIQRHIMEFRLYVRSISTTEDVWTVNIHPQFIDIEPDCLFRIFQEFPWLSVQRHQPPHSELHNVWCSNEGIHMEFIIIRPDETSPPTRQTSAQACIDYVRKLSPVMNRAFQIMKKHCHHHDK